MKTFVVLFFSFCDSNLFAKELNFIKLYGLRDQHTLNNEFRGRSNVELNSSKGFRDLYNSLNSEKIEKIDEGIEKAYNHPYYSKALLSQAVLINDYLLEIKGQDFLVAEISNPVFPELNLFNVRTDSFSLQRKIKYSQADVIPKLVYMNKWYIDQTYSLEEIVTDDLKVDLKNGETITPLYFDLYLKKETNSITYKLLATGFELTNVDKYDYSEVLLEAEKKINKKLKLSISLSPIYIGNYSFFDRAGLTIQYKPIQNIKIKGKASKLEKEFKVDAYGKNLFISCGLLSISESYLKNKSINNIFTNIGIQY